MMYGHGFGWGWMWLGGLVVVLLVTALIVWIVFAFNTRASSPTRGGPVAVSSARQIAEERLARGELSPDEFREIMRALDEPT